MKRFPKTRISRIIIKLKSENFTKYVMFSFYFISIYSYFKFDAILKLNKFYLRVIECLPFIGIEFIEW
jgi:hypothetical protein